MTGSFTTDDGLRLAFDDRGSGHPVLCLAGLSRNMADFDAVTERFAGVARIIRLDSRGRGQSDFDPDFHNYNLLREGRDTLALLDHLGLGRVSILGTSRGGLIAMLLAAEHAGRLAGVIFNDIGPAVEPTGLAGIMGYIGRRPDYSSYEDAADRLPEAMAPRFRNVPRETWLRHARALWIETSGGLDLRYDPALRQALQEQATDDGRLPDVWPLFDALAPVPLALVRGANSDILSAETAGEMQRRRPDMIRADIPDRGHVPFLDEPGAVGAIARYLERVA
ncbi:alpha/beta fold hydrolase [Tropicimonas sp.]|uniref:alpha/beta fold hydrolase n=1 Tax=Tropicimonas sp. TaxID=2067044 RepID=UPI003A854699